MGRWHLYIDDNVRGVRVCHRDTETISHSRVDGNPDAVPAKAGNHKHWIPASAGMTPPWSLCLSG